MRSRDDLLRFGTPCYVKLGYSTAGCGVWHLRDQQEAERIAARLDNEGLLGQRREVMVQRPAPRVFSVVQSVFQHGRLVAGTLTRHVRSESAAAPGGAWAGASRRDGPSPRLGSHLRYGALMLDYLFDEAPVAPPTSKPNPRIGETWNATLSGVNICEAMLEVSQGITARPRLCGLAGRPDPWTSQQAAGAGPESRFPAERSWPRSAAALRGEGIDGGSQDAGRPCVDSASLLPTLVVATMVFINPRAADRFVERAVDHYALTESAAEQVRQCHAARSAGRTIKAWKSGTPLPTIASSPSTIVPVGRSLESTATSGGSQSPRRLDQASE